MPLPLSTSVKTIAPTGRISVELDCIKCSYVLRGMSISARCPECGEPVSSSLSARTLDNIDYARGGLEDYGGSLKLAGIALIGILLVPVLGPLAAILMAGMAFVRVSSTGRLMRSGLARPGPLSRLFRLAHLISWPVAVWATITTVAILHDAIGRWGIWLTPLQARAMVLVWIVLVAVEIGVGIAVARRAAKMIEVGWFDALFRGSVAAIAIGLAVQFLMIASSARGGAPGGGGAMIAGQILLVWIPLLAGAWMLGKLVQRLSDVVNDLHWASSTESVHSTTG